MKQRIDQQGTWRIAVGDVEPSAVFEPSDWRRGTSRAQSLGTDPREFSVGIEILQFGGGVTPRALLGGVFITGGSELIFEVGNTGPITLGASRKCASVLGGPLVTGLPSEFVESILEGLDRMAGSKVQRAGVLRIQAAGYDEEHSSANAFSRAGAGLLWLVNERLANPIDEEYEISELIQLW